MKKLSLLFFACVIFFISSESFAQQTLVLSNYTFSEHTTLIGTISDREPGSSTNLKLVGPSNSIFRIDKDKKLYIKQGRKDADALYKDVIIEFQTPQGKSTDTIRVVKDQFIRNQVIAHRGAWKQHGTSENSIAALQYAIKLGCMGSEFDVHMSADSILVVNHDHIVGQVPIETTSASQLAELKLSNGENLPTVAAYLKEGMKQNKTKLILEIKPSKISKERSIALARKVVEMVEALKSQGWTDYISFDYDICKTIMQLAPYAKVAYLNGDKSPAELANDRLFGLDYNYNVLKKNEQWLEEARKHKITVNVWTVNDKETMQWFLDRKADFITTNEPELLLGIIQK
ncbi:glycerophosphodiester phosphodiesterase [Rhodocytophaga rosea]|uniref:Glycerophosphodiester phosphodiesterase n=1 Tax=Rhodocytophaga rosea TaxID=2704465 RepID=A0A6C0GG59_9BACT|nr:glycerophosphodiester phosphodiesterase family protein [Rhodocytophaga rosea]QHT66996.1 glycerophosphodiester phosphodiesterase [Rhodocytophaga rosea]